MSKREDLRKKKSVIDRRNKLFVIVGVAIISIAVIAIIITSQLNSIEKVVSVTPNPRPQENGLSMGDPNAPVKMDVYSDFQCPYCRRLAEEIEPGLVVKYVSTGKLLITYHPFNVIGPESDDAAKAAYCASEQNKFWEFHDILYANFTGENVGDFTPKRLKAYAANLGLGTTAFNSCVDSNKYADQIQKDQTEGETLKVSYTPSTFLNGTLVDTDKLDAKIAELAAK